MKKGLSRRKSKESQQKIPEPSSSTTFSSTLATTTSAPTVAASEISVDSLRVALAKEIRKFVSKELKYKTFRTHGARTFEEKLEEEMPDIEAPSELVPMSKPRKRKEESLPSTVCEEDQKVVMLMFVNSTRKPYTAAIEMAKTENEGQCVEVCERSHEW
ncbi:hypothetical protein OESDEN_02192 [Oesophagostomum dentatum]|uniref:Uncharacterized protein n=1 Tax=Oesophagostomum dentatum TaxID=61180 RepID=A0A0B1TPS0_OESDE|nr:hypothetical protein OESDEN_02192 [Oesophagostomum dentatum]